MKFSDEFAIHLGANLNEAVRNELHIGAAITCLNDVERQFPAAAHCRDIYFGIQGTTVFNTFYTKQNYRCDKSGYTLKYLPIGSAAGPPAGGDSTTRGVCFGWARTLCPINTAAF